MREEKKKKTKRRKKKKEKKKNEIGDKPEGDGIVRSILCKCGKVLEPLWMEKIRLFIYLFIYYLFILFIYLLFI